MFYVVLTEAWDPVRGVATGAAKGAKAPPLQFQDQARSNSFSFKHQRCFFLRVFRNYTDRNLTIFIVNAKIFGQFTAAFHSYIGEIDDFTYAGHSEKVQY